MKFKLTGATMYPGIEGYQRAVRWMLAYWTLSNKPGDVVVVQFGCN